MNQNANTERARRPRIGITLGDPGGVGPEVVMQCLQDSRLLKFMQPLIIGSPAVLKMHGQKLGYRDLRVNVVHEPPANIDRPGLFVLDVTQGEEAEFALGQITEAGGRLSMQAVERAANLCLSGALDGMATAPISKEAIALAGYTDPGHTEFIARMAGCDEYTMMMVSGDLRVGLVTAHMAIWDVPRHVTFEAILSRIEVITSSLQRDFGIERPKIAVLSLNPHAGDGGVLGHEEIETIVPAIAAACDQGYLAVGPFAADGFFAVGAYRNYDAVLAMYHDQGLVPFKTLAFDSGVNYTAGLPIVRTSPDHGTAYDIAGEGKANPGSMRSALYLAVDIARRRAAAAERRGSAA